MWYHHVDFRRRRYVLRSLNGSQHLTEVIQGVEFVDGIKPQERRRLTLLIHHFLQYRILNK